MIKFALKCDQGHEFESWFQSSTAFETLSSAGHICCATCGTADVHKSLMTPRVTSGRDKAAKDETVVGAKETGALSTPATPAEAALAELRKKISQNSEYVGNRFVDEARAMHDGDSEKRSIHGEAKLEDAKKLIDDGVPIAPLPFLPSRKTN